MNFYYDSSPEYVIRPPKKWSAWVLKQEPGVFRGENLPPIPALSPPLPSPRVPLHLPSPCEDAIMERTFFFPKAGEGTILSLLGTPNVPQF